jgi:hypothetical protein
VIALIAVPALVALATLLSRRFGHAIGGVMAGLPLTSGPLSIALAVGHGASFAARAAVGSLVGIAAASTACVAYGLLARRGWRGATAVALAAFAVAVAVGVALPATLASAAVVAVVLALAALAILRRLRAPAAPPPPVLGLAPRVVSAFVVVAIVLAVARAVGPELAGALTPLPVVIGVLAIHAHRDDGAGAAIEVLFGSQRGTFGFIAFFVVVAELLSRDVALAIVYVAATGAALAAAVIATQVSGRTSAA